MREFDNPFEMPDKWHRANLHTHTTSSDGDADVAERVRQYRGKGYDILAITDHGTTNDVEALSSDEFLVISGVEVGGPGEREGGAYYHLVCIGVPHGTALPDRSEPRKIIRRVEEIGGATVLAHPYWCGQRTEDCLPFAEATAVEVFNGVCHTIGKGFNSVHWDDMLGAGIRTGAVAVDDAHCEANTGS